MNKIDKELIDGIIYLIERNSVNYKGFNGSQYEIELFFCNKQINIDIDPDLESVDIFIKGKLNWFHDTYGVLAVGAGKTKKSKRVDKLISCIRKKCNLEKIYLNEEFIEDIKIFKRQNTLDKLLD